MPWNRRIFPAPPCIGWDKREKGAKKHGGTNGTGWAAAADGCGALPNLWVSLPYRDDGGHCAAGLGHTLPLGFPAGGGEGLLLRGAGAFAPGHLPAVFAAGVRLPAAAVPGGDVGGLAPVYAGALCPAGLCGGAAGGLSLHRLWPFGDSLLSAAVFPLPIPGGMRLLPGGEGEPSALKTAVLLPHRRGGGGEAANGVPALFHAHGVHCRAGGAALPFADVGSVSPGAAVPL